LVQWKHLPTDDANWELTQKLLDEFLLTILEDKDPLDGGE
jgi:hypothetical protein